jgi:hypothetical protein
MLISLNLLLLLVFAFFLGRFGYRRGLSPELVTACGLIIAYFIFDLFARYIIIGGLNLILVVASALVSRVQGAPPGAINYNVNYDALSDAWKLGLNVFSFVFLAIISYIMGSRLVKGAGTPQKPAKSGLGAIMGAINSAIIAATVFRISGAPDLSVVDWRFVFTPPTIDLRVLGDRSNPLATWTIWLPLILAAVVFTLLLNVFSKGLPSKSVTRTRIFYVLGIAILVALVITFATINRRA